MQLAAVPALTFSKTGPDSVLAGHAAAFTLKATNLPSADAVPLYNSSFRDVLAPGVTYQAGSTTPSDVGEPTIRTAQVEFPAGSGTMVDQQTLIWTNVADIAVSADLSISYKTVPNNTLYPVGSTFDNSAQAYGSTDPRLVPAFTTTGTPISSAATIVSASDTETTSITAISIDKSDDLSAEGKLLRGVHDDAAIYTLLVTNNSFLPTNTITVVDYLPANLEFLGCGNSDNSAAPEYPGSGPLGTRTVAANCATPTSVETVLNPPGKTGVYTKVTWQITGLAADEERRISYAAAIPLRQNTTTFPGGTPTPTSNAQGANLGNNTGASTRQDGVGGSVTNEATVSGTYTGPTPTNPTGGALVTDSTTHTVTAKDIRVLKSVSTNGSAQSKLATFVIDQIATFQLAIATSEYTDSSAINLTDTLPNGLCPLMSQTQWDTLVAGNPTLAGVTGCVASASQNPTLSDGSAVSLQTVTYNAGPGTFSVAFSSIPALAAQSEVVLTYQSRMLEYYPGGATAGTQTSAGDDFTNSVTQTATTTPIAGTGETGNLQTTDTSQAELVTTASRISKTIKQQSSSAYTCDGTGYVNPARTTVDPLSVTFAKGDLICFELRVDFATGVRTREPVINDFLPAGTTYVPGSAQLAPSNTLPAAQVNLDTSTAANGTLTWSLGQTVAGVRVVDPGEVFAVRIAVRVDNPADGLTVDIRGNLMKLRAINSLGRAVSLRDQVDFNQAPVFQLSIQKGVANVDGLPAGGNPPGVDGAAVREGNAVTYRLDISHDGVLATGTAAAVSAITVWDVLPTQFTCANITNLGGGVCRDAANMGDWNPTVTGRSIIRWTIPGPLTAGSSTPLNYTLLVPQIGVGITATNTAYISSYQVQNNDRTGTVPYYPTGNIDGTIPAAAQNAVTKPAESSVITTANASVSKTVTSAINLPGVNNGLGQAAIGELFTFTLAARIPAHLTVYSASLQDVLPVAGVELLNAAYPPAAVLVPDAAAPTVTTALPAGFTLNPASGVLGFPATYTNNTDTDQLIQVSLTGRFTSAAGAHGATRDNTARFTHTPAGGGPTVLDSVARLTVVEPSPAINKSVLPAGPYRAGQTVTYTVTASNASGRPTAYDGWVTDCLPAGLSFVAFVAGSPAVGSAATPVPGDGTNGCASGTTRIAWHVGDLAANSSAALNYTATVSSAAAAGASYTNTAGISVTSIPGNRATPQAAIPAGSKAYTASRNVTVTVATPTVTKTVNPTSANIGQTVTYTATATIPAQVNLYRAVLWDLLPAGLDATTLNTVSLTCTQAGNPCATGSTPLAGVAVGTNTRVGWELGDLAAATDPRTITAVYTVAVKDLPASVRGGSVTNGALIKWNSNPGGPLPTYTGSETRVTAALRITEPVIRIAKTTTNSTPEPGQPFGYTLRVTNGGQAADTNAGPAYGVVVTDPVPAAVVIDPATLPSGVSLTGTAANGSGGTLTWTIPGPLAVGTAAAVTVTVNATLAPSATIDAAAKTNTATISDSYSQPGSTGRHSTPGTAASVAVTPDFPQATVAKTAVSVNPTYAGTPFTWRITVTNTGTGRGYNFAATDVLPPNWSYDTGSAQISVGGAAATQINPVVTPATGADGPTLNWSGLATLGADPATTGLPPNGTVVITFTATPSAAAQTEVGNAAAQTNRATAAVTDATSASGNLTGSYAPGTASAVARINAADLRAEKTAGVFTAGGTGTWTMTLSNGGPDTAVGPFTLVDTVPATLTLPDASAGAPLTIVSAVGSGWSCAIDDHLISCQRTNGAETLPAGGAFPAVTVTVSVPADAASGSTATNSVTVSGRTFDPALTNNTATATGTITTEGDLRLVKGLSGSMTAGTDASYLLAVTNLGPSVSVATAAAPIVITETLPAGTTFVSATGDGWSCDTPIGQTLTCRWSSTLAVNASADVLTVTVNVPSDRLADVVNTATVTPGATPDLNVRGGVNTATVTTTPATAADLGLSKTLEDKATTPPVAGTDRTYLLSVTNYGPSDAQPAVVITDPLPNGVSFTGSQDIAGSWTCAETVTPASDHTVTCTLDGSLAGSTNAPVTATVRIGISIADDIGTELPLINTASVTSPTPDPGPAANTATDNSSVIGEADLEIRKTITTPATAGAAMSYQLEVINNGPSTSGSPLGVRETLPVGMTFAALPSGTGWTCAVVPDVERSVDCSYGATLAPGASVFITVPVLVDEGSSGPLNNTASVFGPLTDTVPANNIATRPTPINRVADVTIAKIANDVTVTAGTETSYSIDVVNNGPSTARGVTVVEEPEQGLTIIGMSGDGWICTLATLTCARDILTVAQGSSRIDVTAAVDPSVPTGTVLTNATDLTVITTPATVDPPAWHAEADITVDTLAGVSLTKTHDTATDPVVAGQTVTFELIAANAGPSDAVGPIVITDTLPAGMTYVSATGAWDCVAGTVGPTGQQVDCTLNVAPLRITAGGSTQELTITALVGADVQPGLLVDGSLVNTADVSTGTPQDPEVDTTATDAVPITTMADLSITKAHTGNALAGTEFTWTITVVNNGPSVSRAGADTPITVTDVLPSGTTFVSGGNAEFSCAAGVLPQEVVCVRTADLGLDPAGVSFPITVAVDPAQLTPVNNSGVVVVGITPEPETDSAADNNSTSDEAEVETRADLSVDKSHADGDRAVAGTPFTWTIEVTNAGPSDSFASQQFPIQLTDELPVGVSFASAESEAFSCQPEQNNTTVLCSRDTPLPPGLYTITLVGLVAADTLGDPGLDGATVTNSVEITASTTDDLAGDNADTDTVPLDTVADLSIVKTHDPSAVAVPGTSFVWTLQVANLGPSVSRGSVDGLITVTDTLPEGVTATDVSGQGWECVVIGQDVTCVWGTVEAPADMPVGDAPAITITGLVGTALLGQLDNAAVVVPGTTFDPDAEFTDPAETNNISVDTPAVLVPSADLVITKTHDSEAVRISDEIEFVLAVSNIGPSAARDVVVTDTLPDGLTFVSATADGWTCDFYDAVVTCSFGNEEGASVLEPLGTPGVSDQIILVRALVTPAAYPAVDNVATVTSSTADPNPVNSTATDTVLVPAQADLSLVKTLDAGFGDGELVVGQEARYLLTVTNNGSTEVPGPITVVDTVPSTLSTVSAQWVPPAGSPEGTCVIALASVSCQRPGPLPVDGTAVIELIVRVSPQAFPEVTNTAVVSSDTEDLVPTNNTGSLTSPVTPVVGLVLTKSLDGDVGAGGEVAWVLAVTNGGPSDSMDPIEVVDNLPAELAYQGFAGDGWECSAVGQRVTCAYAAVLPAGAETSVVLNTLLTAAPGATVVNTAGLVGADIEVQPASAGVTAPLVPPAPPGDGDIAYTGLPGMTLLWWAFALILAGVAVQASPGLARRGSMRRGSMRRA